MADGVTGLEQLPARPAADREQGDRLAESEVPKARTRQTESILCRNLAQETYLPESDTSRPVPASRAAGTEDHLDERNVLSPECKTDPHQPGDQAIASERTETWEDENKSLSNLRRQWLRTDLAVACGPKHRVSSYPSDLSMDIGSWS